MKVIKEPRLIDVFVNITYSVKNDELKQTFEFNVSNKKHLDYLFDNRFLFKNKIDRIIKDNVLEGFIRRVDDNDKVEIYYENQKPPKPIIRKINCIVPPFFGCEFCKHATKKGGFTYCKEKKKHYPKDGIKRCPIFRCSELELT